MRAKTITTIKPRRQGARSRVVAATVCVCALAMPASAGAEPIDGASPVKIDASARKDTAPLPGFGTAMTRSEMQGQDPAPLPGFGTAMTRSGMRGSELADARESSLADATRLGTSPAGAADGFDWASAVVGAGAVMALTALCSAVFITLRRRTAVSPSPSAG
jgi:hypothetical protein